MITPQQLIENRERLIAWQRERWGRPSRAGETRIHAGCGHLILPEYVNVDLYTGEADLKADLRDLPYEPNTVDEIVAQHVLEHIPLRQLVPTLRHFHEILRPGGTLEIGMPDVELCMQAFLNSEDDYRWQWPIWTIYGGQTEDGMPGFPTDPTKRFAPGQVHMGGVTLGYLIRLLEGIGFRLLLAFQYDGFGTPSAFVYAEKRDGTTPPVLLEQDVALGVFTHRTDYLEGLWDSVREHLPGISFITMLRDGPINRNMERLRQEFLKSGKRYWVFLDDDIHFLHPDTVKDAVQQMIAGNHAAMSVYSTFDPGWIRGGYRVEGLSARETRWATGYFIMVDSKRVGNIVPDQDLPDGNTAVDTSYSVAIRAAGHTIGIAPHVVYHTRKEVLARPEIVEVTNAYLQKKWGDFYFEVARYDGNVLEWN